jgi:hypothetical protein
MDRFELQPLCSSALPEVAAFLGQQLNQESKSTSNIERRLRWLLLENPAAQDGTPAGYCARDGNGAIRGLSLCFPVNFLAADQRLRGLGSGSFFVDAPARSMGFYLFKRYLRIPGYAFYYASTCNAVSSELWKSMGGSAVPDSETEYLVPLRLDPTIPALVASRTDSQSAFRIARALGQAANPLFQFLTRPSPHLFVKPCQDWQTLSDLAFRHRPAGSITCERSPQFLEWSYGPSSPLYPCAVYLVSDRRGNQAWFTLGDLSRGKQQPFRESVLLDVIWPADQMNFKDLFLSILRAAAEQADALLLSARPGIDLRQLHPWVLRRRLPAPRAYVISPRGAPALALRSFEYDDSDYIAWRFD